MSTFKFYRVVDQCGVVNFKVSYVTRDGLLEQVPSVCGGIFERLPTRVPPAPDIRHVESINLSVNIHILIVLTSMINYVYGRLCVVLFWDELGRYVPI